MPRDSNHNEEKSSWQLYKERTAKRREEKLHREAKVVSTASKFAGVPVSEEMAVKAIKHKKAQQKFKFTVLVSICIILAFMVTVYSSSNQRIDVVDFRPYRNQSYSKEVTSELVRKKAVKDKAITDLSASVNEMLTVTPTGDTSSPVAIDLPDIKAGPRKIRSDIFDEDFQEINQYLYDYCTKYCKISLTLNGATTDIDGILPMMAATSESGGWLLTPTKTCSSIFPSAFVDIHADPTDPGHYYKNIIETCNIFITLFEAAKTGNLYAGSNYYMSCMPWGADLGTQGPLTQAFKSSLKGLGTNEYLTLTSSQDDLSNLKLLYPDGYIDGILETCTGSGHDFVGSYGMIADTGDRWRLKDILTVFKDNVETAIAGIDKYYPFNDPPNEYETFEILRFTNWLPYMLTYTKEVYDSNTKVNFPKYQEWFMVLRIAGYQEIVNYITDLVNKDLANNSATRLYNLTWTQKHENKIESIIDSLPEARRTWTAKDGKTYVLTYKDLKLNSGSKSYRFPFEWLYSYIMLKSIFSEEATS